MLNNVVWTTEGPCGVENFTEVKKRLIGTGRPRSVSSVDKFPRMIDYVIPSGFVSPTATECGSVPTSARGRR